MKKLVFLGVFCGIICSVMRIAAQDTTDFKKNICITAEVGGGFCKYPLFSSEIAPGFGFGVGVRYDFNRYWGAATGLRYEHYFYDDDFSYRNVVFPFEMEFHRPYFYVRGGAVLGFGINVWTAANAKEVFYVGGTLGIGGRIPLTPADRLTIGLHSALVESFDYVYNGGKGNHDTSVPHHLCESFPRYRVLLSIGYEHRF